MTIPKGLLVYATGKTEEIRDPFGKNMIRHCEHCGSELFFEGADTIAEDQATAIPGSRQEENLKKVQRYTGRIPPNNGGCIVYIQRPRP